MLLFAAPVSNQTRDMSILGDQANTYEQLNTTDRSVSTPYQEIGNVQPCTHIIVWNSELLVGYYMYMFV